MDLSASKSKSPTWPSWPFTVQLDPDADTYGGRAALDGIPRLPPQVKVVDQPEGGRHHLTPENILERMARVRAMRDKR